MKLDQLNAATADEARAVFLSFAHIDRWADEMVSARPFASVADAVAAVDACANPWTDEEIGSALSRHPRIGERAQGGEADAVMSRAEQAAVDPNDAALQKRLLDGNASYEERFGHVFLIRAAGRSPAQILEALDERLLNTPGQERRIASQQLREIAALRLEGVLN